VVVARAREIGAETIGDCPPPAMAGAALAGMCAAVGQKAVIFAPSLHPRPRWPSCWFTVQKSSLVDGSYDDAFDR